MAEHAQEFLNLGSAGPVGLGLHQRRLLSVEIRPRRLGFAVFEGVSALLDWGARSYPKESGETKAARSIERLMDLYAPQSLVVRLRSGPPGRTSAVKRELESATTRRSIPMKTIDSETIQRFFAEHKLKTKHQIATALSEWFEELSWKLPPNRRLWQSEHYNMVVFDAVGTGMVFMASERSS